MGPDHPSSLSLGLGRIGGLMDDDDYDDFDEYKPDVMCQRADALRDLATQVDATKDKQARALLITAMERIIATMQSLVVVEEDGSVVPFKRKSK